MVRQNGGDVVTRVFPAGVSLGLGWAIGCTSFAALDDTRIEPPSEPASIGNGSGGVGPVVPPYPDPIPGRLGPSVPEVVAPPPLNQPAAVEVPDAGAASLPPEDLLPTPGGGASPPDPDVEVPACLGSALSLDGSTFASVPRVIEDDFTVEVWIQTTESLTGNSGFYGLAVFDADVPGSGQNDDFSGSVLNDRFAFAVGNPDTTVQGITPVSTGQWVHVAVTRRRSTGQLIIIINGVPDAVAVVPNRAALAAAMTISFGGSSLERNFIGLIDEVKIWNVVRDPAQIASNMRVRPNGSEEGLIGYYSFEDQASSQTADGSSMGLAATLTGAPVYVPSSALCTPGQAP
jgi:Concanavalin A-like lectin/glucanases superfamily